MGLSYRIGHAVWIRLEIFWCNLYRRGANKKIRSILERSPREKEGKILIEALWDHPHHWIRLALILRSFRSSYGSEVIGLFRQDALPRVQKTLKSMGTSDEIMLPKKIPDYCIEKADRLLHDVNSIEKLFDVEIAPGYPSHYFYDGVLKREMAGQIDLTGSVLKVHLARTLFYIEFFKKVFDENEFRAIVISHPTTIRFSTLAYCAVEAGVPTFILNYRNEHITVRKISDLSLLGFDTEDSPTVVDLANLTQQSRGALIARGRQFLDRLWKGEAGEISITKSRAPTNEVRHNARELANAVGGDPAKPNVVVLTSCWPDFPNALGKTFFGDHVGWFKLTLSSAKMNPQYNWIFKPHPAEYLYGNQTSLSGLFREMDTRGVYLWPDNFSVVRLDQCSDCVVTAHGSAGFEFPAIGARALVARETNYTNWGFSNFARSEQEYIKMLSRACELPLPTKEMRENALIYIALRLTATDEKTFAGYAYPWGRLGHKLWPNLSKFITKNMCFFDAEVGVMESWHGSNQRSYNVFKHLRNHSF